MSSFLFTVLSFSVALGLLIFVHELGHFLVAKGVGVRVLRFSIGFGPIVFARRRGETEYALSAIPMGGYVKMLGEGDADDPEAAANPERAFSTQGLLRRIAIVFAGPAMNFLFAFVAYVLLFSTVGLEAPSDEPRVGGVVAGKPAEQAGLHPGDLVVSIGGRTVDTWTDLATLVQRSEGRPLDFVVDRGGTTLPIRVTPQLEEQTTMFGESAGQVYRIGIEVSREHLRVSSDEAVGRAAEQTWRASLLVVTGLYYMVQGRVPLSELGGPIRIAQAAGQQARAGASRFIGMLAFLSVNLAVLNLLPIPALDGGHLAFFAIEGAMRRPLRQRHREIAQQVGVLLLITLMVFVFYNDIHHLMRG